MIKQITIRLNPYLCLFPYEKIGQDISFNDGDGGRIKKYAWLIFNLEITIKYKK